jgi:DNA-binding transcriptional ArsR family regulator
MLDAAASDGRDPLDVLGDAHRRTIIRLLGEGERSVQQLADGLPISRPAVSRHLRLLKEAGLVEDHAAGTRNVFHLKPEALAEIQSHLAELWGNAAIRFRMLAENVEATSEAIDDV